MIASVGVCVGWCECECECECAPCAVLGVFVVHLQIPSHIDKLHKLANLGVTLRTRGMTPLTWVATAPTRACH